MNVLTKTYNGWRNYETWVTNMWLNNEESSYALMQDILQDEGVPDYEKAERLESLLRYQLDDEIAVPCIWQDLLRHAFSQVDWLEIITNNCE